MFKFYFRKVKVKRNKINRKEFLEKKETARNLVLNRLLHYNQYYKLNWNKVFIKNHTTRWGSCSSKKNLNFNYRIVDLPAHLADYIIVHELCHLKEFNHSQKFWDLVGERIQDYIKLINELKNIKIK